MRVGTERGKPFEGLSESTCRRREAAVSQQVGCGGAHDSPLEGAAVHELFSTVHGPRSTVHTDYGSKVSIIGTAATAMGEEEPAVRNRVSREDGRKERVSTPDSDFRGSSART